ncbi:MAG: type II toxin-antitoxin system RelB/DinJ family antitoxin [Selenomonadaceae bacterium]|nr:type II toxin-antitoxin system RelB/DinJ family antitoxin [Selenomonadaceae bacterium]
MPATKTLNIRVDAGLKSQAERIFTELGIPISTAVNMFLKSVVRYGGVPLNLRLNNEELPESDPFWSDTNQKHLTAAISRMEKHGGQEHDLIDA